MSRRTALALTLVLLCSVVALFGADVAQTDLAMAQASATGTVIVTLGPRGGPFPTRNRTQSSNLLVVNGTLYLIDAGDGVTRRIVQPGYDFRKVGKIFITHLHDDHTAGLATLLVSVGISEPRDRHLWQRG